MAQASAFANLADTDTPVSAWLKLKSLRPRYLLESVEQGQRVARFSFLGFGEVRLTRIEDGQLRDASGRVSAAPQTQDELLDSQRGALQHAPT